MVAERRVEEALALLGEASADCEIERGRQIARAHAFAAIDDVGQADAALGWVHDNFGADGLGRALEPEGPASALARARLEGPRGPYRG